MQKRRSTLSKIVVKRDTPALAICCGCGVDVNPGHCYRGKVLKGHGLAEHHGSMLVGPNLIHTIRFMRVPQYVKGYICDTCASNYHSVIRVNPVTGEETRTPIVITDPLPGFIGQTKQGG